jgi:hypothetical protein
MPALLSSTFTIPLNVAKTHGLAELGVPLHDSTEVKKGKLAEAMQWLEDGKIGRRFQNLRATLVRTHEGGHANVQLLLACEVFGDDAVPVGAPSALSVQLWGGEQCLAETPLGPLYLPYGVHWYDNQFALKLAPETFASADRVSLLAAADEVRGL